MTRYAQGTSVTVERSRIEIERTLQRYGATGFGYGWDDNRATVAFQIAGRMVRFELAMPPLSDFSRSPSGRIARTLEQQRIEREKAMRQRWRALTLVIKAKLEAVESEISTVEKEFMAHIVLPDGSTVAEFMAPQLDAAYSNGTMPRLLPAGRDD